MMLGLNVWMVDGLVERQLIFCLALNIQELYDHTAPVNLLPEQTNDPILDGIG